uniref:COP9 signalosome subunit 7B n=1 Tax=Oryctolagus cuniculus TaxID=9986 RepID=A0A5F9C103_RABIT
MAGEQKPSSNLLEQFILLAKGTSGSALTALISQVLEAPGVYVFGELLELANVQELAEGANAAYLQLLKLFAYGTYPDYIANKESLPELSTAQQNKLKHLTIVSLASRMKCIPYSVLLKDLEMRNLRELEDLIIEAVYTDIIQGKLDQRNQLLEVDFCIGRDIRKKDINNIVKTLHEWCDGCEAVLLGIEQQVLRANQYKENHNRTQQQVEAEGGRLDVPPPPDLRITASVWLPTSRRRSKRPRPPRPRKWSSSWPNGSVPLMLSRGSPPRRCPK